MSPIQAVLTHSAIPWLSLTSLSLEGNSFDTLGLSPPYRGEVLTSVGKHSIIVNTKNKVIFFVLYAHTMVHCPFWLE